MDVESTDPLSPERGVSSEPGTTTRPFEGEESEQPSARKRQRVSSSGQSRSRSVDATTDMASFNDTSILDTAMGEIEMSPASPHTPPQDISSVEPTSSKVTLNLKQKVVGEAQSSVPESPSNMASPPDHATDDSSSDIVLPKPTETPSSSPSASGSPLIEVVTIEDDEPEYQSETPGIEIVGEDNEPLVYIDPLEDFPFTSRGESLVTVMRKIANFVEYGMIPVFQSQDSTNTDLETITDENVFQKLQDWIQSYLAITARRPSQWHSDYIRHQEFWDGFPELFGALNRRKQVV